MKYQNIKQIDLHKYLPDGEYLQDHDTISRKKRANQEYTAKETSISESYMDNKSTEFITIMIDVHDSPVSPRNFTGYIKTSFERHYMSGTPNNRRIGDLVFQTKREGGLLKSTLELLTIEGRCTASISFCKTPSRSSQKNFLNTVLMTKQDVIRMENLLDSIISKMRRDGVTGGHVI